MIQDTGEFASLLTLLEDDDPVVQDCVQKRLYALGHDAVEGMLAEMQVSRDASLRKLYRYQADSLNYRLRIDELGIFAEHAHKPLSIFEGSFLICSLFDCSLRHDDFEDLFINCLKEYNAEASDRRTGYEDIRVFNHIFFHRLGFKLYDVEVSDPEYASVHQTLTSRKGNPFTLSLIYLMMAQAAGLPLQLVCFTGGFVLVYVENGKDIFYVNIYKEGDIFTKANLDIFIRTAGLKVSEDELKHRDESAILPLYLESLLFLFERRNDNEKCGLIESALKCFGTERFLVIEEDEV